MASMAGKDTIEMQGVVTEELPNTVFRLKLEMTML